MIVYLQMIESPKQKSVFEQVYIQYKSLMYSVAYSILGNSQDAEDAVHHAFVKIAENILQETNEKFSIAASWGMVVVACPTPRPNSRPAERGG